PRQPIALGDRTFAPIAAEPMKRVDDLLGVLLARALPVGVFDAQEHPAAETPRMEEVEDGRARAADVKKARRRRGEAEFHRRPSLHQRKIMILASCGPNADSRSS